MATAVPLFAFIVVATFTVGLLRIAITFFVVLLKSPLMIRGFFTTFLMKQRLGIFGFGKASLGLGLFFIIIIIKNDLSDFFHY